MAKVVMAVVAHPDDIEFMMAGTLFLLKDKGYEVHYMNFGNGSCGTATHDKDTIVTMRTQEARNAAALMGATFHSPLCDDLEILYDRHLISKLGAVIRQVKPQILLLQSPQDYMEDHMNTTRMGVTAAFCRGMLNYPTDPNAAPIDTDMALYHCVPMGLQDQLRNEVFSDFYVDISSVVDKKRDMLACHVSQKEWLDHSQGMDSYLVTMREIAQAVGKQSGKYELAEGWRRHSHIGYGPEDFDPLNDTLADYITERAQ